VPENSIRILNQAVILQMNYLPPLVIYFAGLKQSWHRLLEVFRSHFHSDLRIGGLSLMIGAGVGIAGMIASVVITLRRLSIL